MGDRRAVVDDWFGGARSDGAELRVFRYADLQRFDAVVERKVQQVLSASGQQTIGQSGLHVLGAGTGDADPAPLSFRVPSVEIDAADPGGGHVGHGQAS